MARISARNSEEALAHTAGAVHVHHHLHGRARLKYVPGFAYILALYLAGSFVFPDVRAVLFEWGPYRFTWVEVLLVAAAITAIAEQLRVSHPGIDNTVEAILMVALAASQVLLLALGAAGVSVLAVFNNTEFLLLTLISLTQAVVAILVNARTLRRTIGVGDNT